MTFDHFEVITRSSIESDSKINAMIGYWSSAITKTGDPSFRRIPLSGKILNPKPDQSELTAILKSIEKIPSQAEIFFHTSCLFFYEGITKNIREDPNFYLWKELDEIIQDYKISWKILVSEESVDLRRYARIPSRSLLEQREIYQKTQTKQSRKKIIRRSVITSRQRDDWIKRFKTGKSVQEIANEDQVSTTSVLKELRAKNLWKPPIPRKDKFSQEDRDRWAEKYLNKMRLVDIEKSEIASRCYITSELKRRKIYRAKPPCMSEQERMEIGRKAYHIRENEPLHWYEIMERFDNRANHSQTVRKLARKYAEKLDLPWPIVCKKKKKSIFRKCKISGCNRNVEAKELCGAHYARKARGRDMNKPIQSQNNAYPEGLICKIECCDRSAEIFFMCRSHYRRFKKSVSEEEMNTPIKAKTVKVKEEPSHD